MDPKIITAKQPTSKKSRDWYPYYAGFTERFVHTLLSGHLNTVRRILDPWNGSGTTTAVCAQRGLTSNGVDINPVQTVVARARLLSAHRKSQLISMSDEIVRESYQANRNVEPEDMLLVWMQESSVRYLRSLEAAVHYTCDEGLQQARNRDLAERVSGISPTLCFFYVALFGTVRSLLHEFRTTNPMWIKTPKNQTDRVEQTCMQISICFRNTVLAMVNLLSLSNRDDCYDRTLIDTGDSRSLPFARNTFDAVIGSPPYATRLDYIVGTSPELAVLGASKSNIALLREAATGSPVVKREQHPKELKLESELGNKLLDAIAKHPSKGSKSYYHHWMRNYLHDLNKGLNEIHRTVNQNGWVCLVVQDSRYKELHINLQQITIEMLSVNGRKLVHRIDYAAPNPRFLEVELTSSSTEAQSNIESILVFGGK